MISNSKLISVLALAALLLAGCTGQDKQKAAEITFTGDSASLAISGISAPAAGQDVKLTFKSATDWHIDLQETKSLVSWLVVIPPSGKGGDVEATVSIEANNTLESRTARIDIISGAVTKSIPVSQAARETIEVNSVTLNANNITLYPGESQTLTATVSPADADGDLTVKWTSSNEKVATVKDGTVKAIAEGEATVTATVGGKSGSCVVTVAHKVVDVQSITIDPATAEVLTTETVKLNAVVTPSTAVIDYPVTWTSSDKAIAIVEDGLVTGIHQGEVVITAEAGGKSATCKVTVIPKYFPVESITLDRTSLEMKVNDTATLVATVNPENATDPEVRWSSSDEKVAIVTGGVVTAVGAGEATIVAKAGEKSAECAVKVGHSGSSGEDLDDTINVNPW